MSENPHTQSIEPEAIDDEGCGNVFIEIDRSNISPPNAYDELNSKFYQMDFDVDVNLPPKYADKQLQSRVNEQNFKHQCAIQGQQISQLKSLFWLAVVWIVALFLVIGCNGFGSSSGWFKLSDSVLITLITTTTATILGLYIIAVRWLYKSAQIAQNI